MPHWDERAPAVGTAVHDVAFLDEEGHPALLSSAADGRALLLLCFGGPDDQEGARLLRSYRDATLLFLRAGVNVAAVARADAPSLYFLKRERGLGFPVYADPSGTVLSHLGIGERVGLFLFDRNLVVRQRALGNRAPPEVLLTFVKRGGIKARRKLPVLKLKQAWSSLRHALATRKLAR